MSSLPTLIIIRLIYSLSVERTGCMLDWQRGNLRQGAYSDMGRPDSAIIEDSASFCEKKNKQIIEYLLASIWESSDVKETGK